MLKDEGIEIPMVTTEQILPWLEIIPLQASSKFQYQ
jgi:hypothetical protein